MPPPVFLIEVGMDQAENPYHQGEIDIQKLVGERDRAILNGAVIKDEILGGALGFIDRQPLIIVASENSDGTLWASIIFGRPGFMHAPNNREVRIDLRETKTLLGDTVLENLKRCPNVGTLLIELDTRRRLKINGRVSEISKSEMTISVLESFPLCPKYIQRRRVRLSSNAAEKSAEIQVFSGGTSLGQEERALIGRSDTMFAVTCHPKDRLDASHRGGAPGFVRVLGETRLQVPDYKGNSMFNSFGNLMENQQTAVIFVDFAQRRTLQISGRAEVLLNQEDPLKETGGTNRFWTIDIDRWQTSALPPLEHEFLDYSPFNPTGLDNCY